MGIDEIEAKIKEIRDKPVLVVYVLPTGWICTATIRECLERGGRFLHVADNELDEFLGMTLGDDGEK